MDIDKIKVVAAGREAELLEYVGHLSREVLDGRHHACPACGGRDRFRYDRDKCFCICSQCFSSKNGDFLAAIMHFRGIDFPTALGETAYRLGLTSTPQPNGQPKPQPSAETPPADDHDPADPLIRLATTKRCPVSGLLAYGAESHPARKCVQFPMFDASGQMCSVFTIWPDDPDDKLRKGMCKKDYPAGLFLPNPGDDPPRLPAPGESWIIVEGVKDAAALEPLEYLVAGLCGKSLKHDLAPAFRGVNVTILLDNDPAGREAAPKVAAQLRGIASAARIATLPSAGDVRDNLHADGGETAVRAAIASASKEATDPWPAEEYDAAQLATLTFDQRYLVEECIVELQPAIGGGPSKTLKTGLLAADLAISCAAGVPWLNRFNVPTAIRVGVVSAESGMATLQETIRRVASVKGVDLEDIGQNLVITPEPTNLCSVEGIDSMIEWCRRREFRMVILDPCYMLFPELAQYASSVYAVGQALRRFATAVIKEGVTPIYIHHTIKSPANKYAPLELQDLSGSGWCEFARGWILLSRRNEYEDGSGRHELHLRIGGSAGHSSLWHLTVEEGEFQPGAKRYWRTNLIQASIARKEQRDQAEEAAEREVEDKAAMIVKHLENMPGKADTENGIFKFGIGRGKAAQEAMQTLLDTGRVAYREGCVCKGGRKTGRDGYQLISQEDNPDEDE